MFDIIRDSAFGFLVRHISRHNLLQHREDQQDFSLSTVDDAFAPSKPQQTSDHSPSSSEYAEDRLSEQHSSPVIQPTHVLVDWYAADDPANPRNWSFGKKSFIATQICLYTFVVYISSAIYTPGIEEVARIFDVSITVSSLGLSIYVIGYGIGPLLFSPLSEVPRIGRNAIYIVTFGLFVILTIPAALADNLAGFLVLRFLQGFFGSPSLATGGATFGDMFDIFQLPFLMAFWMAAGTAGPSLGPTIAGFSVQAKSWRWSIWEILWMAGPTFLLLCFCLPETSADNILLRRARRLRRITGSDRFRSQSEFKQKDMQASAAVREALWRPVQIIAVDPAIAFVALYTSLIYGIYYSFFESFPFVYVDRYGFNLGELGLAFLSIVIAMLLQTPIYLLYLRWQAKRLKAKGFGPQEERLIPALLGCLFPPIGLFIFAWTSDGQIHWIVSLIGITIYNMGFFVVFQCIFIYLPLSYPQYAASLMAGNGLGRSLLGAGAILFSRPLFLSLGVARGVTVLAGLTLGCTFGMYALWYWGARLRARSRFTAT